MLPAVAGKVQPLFRALPTLRPSSRPFSTSLPALMDPWAITKDVGGEANVRRLEAIARDFRTDTITVPSDAMLLAGLQATRGDDVYHEDPTTAALEDRIARLTGKEAGMFCVSGTMTNQLALRTWLLQPPHSVLSDHSAHVYAMEAGGISMHSQAATTTVRPSNGHHLRWTEDVEPNLVLGENIHLAPTKIVSLENTLNGQIFPQDEVVKISENVRKEGIIMHLDGARLWNAAAATGATLQELPEVMKELCDPFESVSLCMSKGLGAPIGSVLVGPAALIKKARWFRKCFGGGVRQSGALAASADFALTHNFDKLRESHAKAKQLGDGLEALGVRLLVKAETNMVFIDPSTIGVSLPTLIARASALATPLGLNGPRIVVHYQISQQAVDDLLHLVAELKEEAIAQGWTPPPPPTTNGTAPGAAPLIPNYVSTPK